MDQFSKKLMDKEGQDKGGLVATFSVSSFHASGYLESQNWKEQMGKLRPRKGEGQLPKAAGKTNRAGGVLDQGGLAPSLAFFALSPT